MIQRFLASLCLLVSVASALHGAQQRSAISLVPAANWRLENSQAIDLNGIREWGEDPAIEREYGVKSVELRTYRLDNKAAQVLIEEASDTAAAYGLFTFYAAQSTAPERGLQLTAKGPEGTLMARGRYFIRIAPPVAGSQLSDGDRRALVVFIGGTRSYADPQSALPAVMPQPDLVPGSEKYIVGPEAARRSLRALPSDLIGFSQGAEVQAGEYQAGRNRVTAVAISYPTPHIARVRFGAMERFLGINQEHGAGSLYGKRQGSFVFLVLDASSASLASRLMDQFQVSQSVSWNQPYPGNESVTVQLVKLILANLALVGILVGLAIIGGGLIFIFRRLAAKWFPTSSWTQPDEGGIIRLNLSR